jgi:beta-1,4-mannosyl-glycoprotein beta-1,4-N-acetylglucosaminyltransferase
MYYDEDTVVDIRLNCLDAHVDKFLIVESKFTHSGRKRDLLFDINQFKHFKNKIVYLVLDHEPQGIEIIDDEDDESAQSFKSIENAIRRENYHRNYIARGLIDADAEDIIMISDADEIPNLENLDLKKIKNKLIIFQQKMFYYKLNLYLDSFSWCGSKACRKKDLISPQWLRNVKDRNYSFWRIDTLFSKNKYQNIYFVNDGGWHFSNIKNAKEIKEKLESYLHHREFDEEPLSVEKIDKIIKEKKTIYDLKVDKSVSKFNKGQKLTTTDLKLLPNYIQNNVGKFKLWLD